jgi:hypothetical protein
MQEEALKSKVSKRTLILATVGVLAGAVFSSYVYSSYTSSSAAEAAVNQTPQQTIVVEEPSATTEPLSIEDEDLNTESGVEVIATIEVSSGDLPKPKTTQNVTNGSSKVTVTPNPKPTTSAPDLKLPGSNSGSNNQQEAAYCPDNRSENPAVYDACRSGFSAPTSWEWAGYHSCKRLSENEVEIYGLVRMIGGNYKEVTHGHPTINGMFLVSSTNTEAPYFLYWDIAVNFWSMDSRYEGRIAQSGNSGSKLIQESQLDPSCRL